MGADSTGKLSQSAANGGAVSAGKGCRIKHHTYVTLALAALVIPAKTTESVRLWDNSLLLWPSPHLASAGVQLWVEIKTRPQPRLDAALKGKRRTSIHAGLLLLATHANSVADTRWNTTRCSMFSRALFRST